MKEIKLLVFWNMAVSEKFFGVADKLLFHRRFKVLLLGICILPDVKACFNRRIQQQYERGRREPELLLAENFLTPTQGQLLLILLLTAGACRTVGS